MKLIKQSVVLAFVLSIGTIVAAPATKENLRDSNTPNRQELQSNSELQSNIDASNENRRSSNRQLSGQNSDNSENLSPSASGDAGSSANQNNMDPDLSTLMFERFKPY